MRVAGVCMELSVVVPLMFVPHPLESTSPTSPTSRYTLRMSGAIVSVIYLQLNGSSSAVDVCPVVNSPSTLSGHYTQPVNVARNLTLQTSNLPSPVSPSSLGEVRSSCGSPPG